MGRQALPTGYLYPVRSRPAPRWAIFRRALEVGEDPVCASLIVAAELLHDALKKGSAVRGQALVRRDDPI